MLANTDAETACEVGVCPVISTMRSPRLDQILGALLASNTSKRSTFTCDMCTKVARRCGKSGLLITCLPVAARISGSLLQTSRDRGTEEGETIFPNRRKDFRCHDSVIDPRYLLVCLYATCSGSGSGSRSIAVGILCMFDLCGCEREKCLRQGSWRIEAGEWFYGTSVEQMQQSAIIVQNVLRRSVGWCVFSS